MIMFFELFLRVVDHLLPVDSFKIEIAPYVVNVSFLVVVDEI
jgi:hypothetical protein